jgi:ribulose-5-phosphate 4-epimerase/fuculose-1-phosphate aldolase
VSALREQLVETARRLHEGGYSPGTSGNISVRDGERLIVSPTGARLGFLDAEQLSVVDLDGRQLDGPPATKESKFHAAVYRARPDAGAIVHLHSPFATAYSCLDGLDADDALPALTPYSVMRVGTLLRVPYAMPGDAGLAELIGNHARRSRSLLLANHGTLTASATLEGAAAAAEEIEETARLFFTLANHPTALLDDAAVAELRVRYP